MGRRRKNRTHLKGINAAAGASGSSGIPKSFIVKHGNVGSSLAQLVRDMRKVMEPNTATRLRERSRNKLRDFLVLAPTLGVTHLLAFTLTPLAPSLRIIRLSAGPTLSFRIERYSLTKDLLSSSRHAKSIGMEYLSPPLLVLASFPSPGPGTPSHLPLVMKSFQSLFPPLSPSTISLSSARRIVLISYNAERGTIDFRHYLISVRAAGISRRVRKIMEGAVGKPKAKGGKILDLGNEKDVADYLLRTRLQEDDGYETGSTSAASEADPDEVSVRLASDYPGRNNRRGEKRAVKLDEIGPRMELQLVKIAEGVPGKEGAVLFHQFVKKGAADIAALKQSAAERQRLKKERREEQERNVLRKKREAGGTGDEGGVQDNDESEEDEGNGEEEDGDEWGDEDMSEGGDTESESEEEDTAPPPKRFRPRSAKYHPPSSKEGFMAYNDKPYVVDPTSFYPSPRTEGPRLSFDGSQISALTPDEMPAGFGGELDAAGPSTVGNESEGDPIFIGSIGNEENEDVELTDEEEEEIPPHVALPLPLEHIYVKDPRQPLLLSDFHVIKTLGTGTFGRVLLVCLHADSPHHRPDTVQHFAMKILRKTEVVKLKQVKHVNAERNILARIQHPFIVDLYATFQDHLNVYMLLSYVPGGELFSHLRRAGRFTPDVTRFYLGGIVLALRYLHSYNIIYRDLKPENLLLDHRGYLRITDFGFAKVVDDRTWTLCGTPEYLAPEIIEQKGHSKAVDWWACGILTYEMLVGYPPFFDENPFGIYQKIVKGRVYWPQELDIASKVFIQAFLNPDRSKRLGNLARGADDVLRHTWFEGVDWAALENGKIPAPLIPQVTSGSDTRNFTSLPFPNPADLPGLFPSASLPPELQRDPDGWQFLDF